MVGGVCGAIAQRTGIDVTVVRVLTVVLAIFGGLGILAYGLAWLFLPEPDGRIHAEQVLRGDLSAGAIGAMLTSVLSLGSFGGFSNHGPADFGWGAGDGAFGILWGLSGTALFIGAIAFVIYLVSRGRSTPPAAGSGPAGPPPYGSAYGAPTYTPPTYTAPTYTAPTYTGPAYGAAGPAGYGGPAAPGATMAAPQLMSPPSMPVAVRPTTPRRPSLGGFGALAVAGLAVIAGATTALVMSNGTYDARTSVMAWAVALGVLGLALVGAGLLGRRAGIVGLFAVIAVIGTAAAAIVPKADHLQGVGDRTWRPVSVTTATKGYGLAVGDATLDLRRLDTTALSTTDPVHVPASVGVGQLVIKVPVGLTVAVRSDVGGGDISMQYGPDLLGDANSGVFVGTDHNDDGDLSGLGIHRTVVVGSGPVELYVDAKVGLGQIRIGQVQG